MDIITVEKCAAGLKNAEHIPSLADDAGLLRCDRLVDYTADVCRCSLRSGVMCSRGTPVSSGQL